VPRQKWPGIREQEVAFAAAAGLRPSRVPSLRKMPWVILLRSALAFHAAAANATSCPLCLCHVVPLPHRTPQRFRSSHAPALLWEVVELRREWGKEDRKWSRVQVGSRARPAPTVKLLPVSSHSLLLPSAPHHPPACRRAGWHQGGRSLVGPGRGASLQRHKRPGPNAAK
jgi:hypothetical protein